MSETKSLLLRTTPNASSRGQLKVFNSGNPQHALSSELPRQHNTVHKSVKHCKAKNNANTYLPYFSSLKDKNNTYILFGLSQNTTIIR
jgi:hypothetical protein